MIKYFCDLCGSETPTQHEVNVRVENGLFVSYDLCKHCENEIKDSREKAEIEAFLKLRRKAK